MAENLLKADIKVMVNDLNQDAVKELVNAGAQEGTPGEIGSSCEVVFTILPNGTIAGMCCLGRRVWQEP